MPVAQPTMIFFPKPFMGIKVGPIPIYYATWFRNIVQLTLPIKDLSGLLTSTGIDCDRYQPEVQQKGDSAKWTEDNVGLRCAKDGQK